MVQADHDLPGGAAVKMLVSSRSFFEVVEMRLRFLTFEGAELTLNYNGHMRVRSLTRVDGSFFEF